MDGLDKLPAWAQFAIGAPLFFFSAYLVVSKFFKEMKRPEPRPMVIEAAELADMNPVRALGPALQRLYDVQSSIDTRLGKQNEVQSDIDHKLARVIDLMEQQAEDARIARAIQADRDRRAGH